MVENGEPAKAVTDLDGLAWLDLALLAGWLGLWAGLAESGMAGLGEGWAVSWLGGLDWRGPARRSELPVFRSQSKKMLARFSFPFGQTPHAARV